MKRNWKRAAAGGALALTAMVTFAACGEQQQIRDLENVTVTNPDKSRLVTNVDTYPNVVAICIEGEGFITTTRDDRPIQQVPEWSATKGGWCGK